MGEAIVDACCFINLYATGEMAAFLGESSWTFYIARAALAESLFIRSHDAEGNPTREPIDFAHLISPGLITITEIGDANEIELYVQLAAELEDGEAMGLAIAKVRGWVLATDDRKANRLANKLGVKVLTTPELLQDWAKCMKVPQTKLGAMLRRVESSARFVPAADAPGHAWWSELVG